ncbi:MAG: phenylalanine--tRNA ligase subunit beta, partial [Clostridia bacterium]|nr:phenylalanine--tRNA ligase subunit beta [Clostridia bacterium]
RDTLCGMGMSEAETFSFISPKYYDKIRMAEDDPRRKSVVISNPLGEDTSVMRTTAIPSMLEMLHNNFAVRNRDAKLFEMASIYVPHGNADELPDEMKRLVIGFYLNDVKDASGFYRMKGYIEALLAVSHAGAAEYAPCTTDTAFHPGRCATVSVNGTPIGIFGEVHPEVASNYGINAPTYVAQLDFDAMFDARVEVVEYVALPKYPALERDFSFVCDEETPVAQLESCMKRAGGALLESVRLFDIYRGPQIGEGKKSVSFAAMLRAAERTLTDEEADGAVKKILKRLEAECGAVLRS